MEGSAFVVPTAGFSDSRLPPLFLPAFLPSVRKGSKATGGTSGAGQPTSHEADYCPSATSGLA
eukprot:12156185-Prorocentrum_lima.AAC.1